ncbi:MAG: hypothetical protein KDH88_04110 [Chromatiales bacterium]|nr:hypothetical protein [Chromatiales bacterium]
MSDRSRHLPQPFGVGRSAQNGGGQESFRTNPQVRAGALGVFDLVVGDSGPLEEIHPIFPQSVSPTLWAQDPLESPLYPFHTPALMHRPPQSADRLSAGLGSVASREGQVQQQRKAARLSRVSPDQGEKPRTGTGSVRLR